MAEYTKGQVRQEVPVMRVDDVNDWKGWLDITKGQVILAIRTSYLQNAGLAELCSES
jgi:hypothetical protein